MFTDIIVGAGSAGCVVAAELSKDPDRRLLVIEAGEHYRSSDTPREVASPNCFPALADGRFLWPLEATLTAISDPMPFQQGRGVGGSSAINNTWAIRARPGDVDRWSQRGCTAISWDELALQYRRLENDVDFGESQEHGAHGPLVISRADEGDWNRVDEAFRWAAEDAGHAWCSDLNASDAQGVGATPMTLAAERRVSANDAFLDPALERASIEVRSATYVERILFEGERAAGVRVRANGSLEDISADGVIVCGGAVQSPALLQRSGLGPPDLLGARGIPVRRAIEGVGRNLVEHPFAYVLFELVDNARLATDDTRPGNILVRPNGDASGDPWHLACLGSSPLGTGFGIGFAALMQPTSRGRVSIDARGDAVVAVNALDSDEDADRLWQGFDRLLDLLSSGSIQELIAGPLMTATGSFDLEAARSESRAWLRANCGPYRHLAGTCQMSDAPEEQGVLDPEHRPFGTERLYVVDASALPDATSSNTNLTVMAVAARFAERMRAGGE